MAERRKRLIVVKHGDLGDINKLEGEKIKQYIKTHTYIDSADKLYLKRIRHALPHKRRKANNGFSRTLLTAQSFCNIAQIEKENRSVNPHSVP